MLVVFHIKTANVELKYIAGRLLSIFNVSSFSVERRAKN